MTRRRKLSDDDCERIIKLINEGHQIKKIAKKFGVHDSTIRKRCKYKRNSRWTPIEIKKKVIQAIKKGYTKAEAAQMYELNIGTVQFFTKEMGIEGHRAQGYHIIRKPGIELLNRLIRNGCIASEYNVPTMRGIQRKFPMIRNARYKNKTFYYLEGREEEAVEVFFKELPDRVISYVAVEELCHLIGVKISRKSSITLMRKFQNKHASYWASRKLVQTSLQNWIDENPFKEIDERFAMLPKKGEW